jgi:biofilm PGA synthesis lipoprotein PgaB
LPASVSAIRANPELFAKWTDLKTGRLIDFTRVLADRARVYRAPLATMRDLYARVVLEPPSRDWFAQDFDRFLGAYDYTAILAMPRLEGVAPGDAQRWLSGLVDAARRHPGALDKTVFELQAVDWTQPADSKQRFISTPVLVDEMRLLMRLGARNFGYYPDDFVIDAPAAAALHRGLSLQSYPYRP